MFKWASRADWLKGIKILRKVTSVIVRPIRIYPDKRIWNNQKVSALLERALECTIFTLVIAGSHSHRSRNLKQRRKVNVNWKLNHSSSFQTNFCWIALSITGCWLCKQAVEHWRASFILLVSAFGTSLKLEASFSFSACLHVLICHWYCSLLPVWYSVQEATAAYGSVCQEPLPLCLSFYPFFSTISPCSHLLLTPFPP